MPLWRRSIAAVSGLFLLQLMVLGSGTLCAMHRGVPGAGAPNHAMAMAGAAHTPAAHQSPGASAGDSDAPASPVDCNGTTDHNGCPMPFAPGQCSSMTACDVAATPAQSLMATADAHFVALALPAPAASHTGPTFAPELPPPRA